jgi:hypothetical protein
MFQSVGIGLLDDCAIATFYSILPLCTSLAQARTRGGVAEGEIGPYSRPAPQLLWTATSQYLDSFTQIDVRLVLYTA